MTAFFYVLTAMIFGALGFSISCFITGNEISQMKIQLDNLNRNSIDKHEAMKQIHQSVCPKQVKGSDFWNAALVEVEERLRGL